ncbi:MAG: MurR/RpiR family transcriptional regulator [Candidatus Nanopelagicales bacterium]
MTSGPPERRNLLHLIAGKADHFSPALRQVADVILARPEDSQAMSITDLAQEAGVAESTVSRFVRELGLTNYNAMRLGIAEAVYSSRGNGDGVTGKAYVYEGILKTDTVAEALGKVGIGSRQAIERTAVLLDPGLIEDVVSRVHAARAIHVVAMGASAVAAENVILRFVRAGKQCSMFRDQSLQVMTAATLGDQDVMLGISDSGATTSVADALLLARQHGAFTVAITSDPRSPVARAADAVLLTGSPLADAGVYGEAVTAKWGQLLVTDALYAAYAVRYYAETLGHLEETYVSGIRGTRAGG